MPLGVMRAEEDAQGITSLRFVDGPTGESGSGADGRWLADAEAQVREYFAGTRRTFDLPLSLSGSDFQRRVWHALMDIPFGETRSYGDVAAALGNPGAARAVGMANNKNPVLIVVPCHRVVGSSGRLMGYAGGLERKRYLLELERTLANRG
ncbi:MAG: methylated-DNA--[Clostridia bacterium]|nr:methylated-DNA--[protein]-cysteine S-methyltransferase [Clostridia bacterium]